MIDPTVIAAIAREAMLFAAAGLLIGGVDDLAVDLSFLWRRLTRRDRGRSSLAALVPPIVPARLAIKVPAWDEEAVIGAMLAAATARIDHPDYRIYVGTYPNDPATIGAVTGVAARDSRIRLVVGPRDGPTTKADCLNTIWRAVMDADAQDGAATRAVILHDAEDMVHPAELRVFDALLGRFQVVQLPVLPLIGRTLVSAHYADEFAESHIKQMVVRTAMGAAMPLAGTGCAIDTALLARIAAIRGGDPFDAVSLVEDYELGLRLAALGARGVFARVADGDGLVAVRSYFPATLGASVRQKARWMTGIALAGWDRTGWMPRRGAVADHWFRARDRRAPLAMLVLAAAYAGAVLWGVTTMLRWNDPVMLPVPGWLLAVNAGLLGWRLAVRAACTTRIYGWWQGALSMPRLLVANTVALAAAPRALIAYARLLAGGAPVWDKTSHDFPAAGGV